MSTTTPEYRHQAFAATVEQRAVVACQVAALVQDLADALLERPGAEYATEYARDHAEEILDAAAGHFEALARLCRGTAPPGNGQRSTVPPLPTDPWTVIQVEWHKGGHTFLVLTPIGWQDVDGNQLRPGGQRDLADLITSFKVLASPANAGYSFTGLRAVR